MGKSIKIFLYILCGLVLLITIGAISLLIFFNPNHYKQEISDKFYAQTGCELQINGDITWSFFPSLSLQINDVIIQNPPKYDTEKSLATLGNVAFSVKLMPLFDHHVETKNIKFNNVEINVIQKTPKQQNLETLVDNFRGKKTHVASSDKVSEKQTNAHGTHITKDDFKLTIGNISINNARINWENIQKQKRSTLLIDSLQSSQVNLEGKPFPLSTNITIKTAETNVTAQLKFSSNMQINLAQQRFKFSSMKTTGNISGPGVPNQQMTLSLASTVGYDFASTQLAITDLTAALNNLTVQGEVNGKLDGLNLQGNLKAPRFDSFKWLQSLGYTITMPDSSLLQNTKINTAFVVTPEQINFSTLRLGLSKATNIHGNLNFMLQTPKIITNLTIDNLDLNKIFPLNITKQYSAEVINVKPTDNTTNPQKSPEKTTQPISMETSKLMAVDQVEAVIGIGQFTYKKIKLANVASKLTLQNQIISLGFANADFYNGKVSGMNTINLSTTPMQISVSEVLQDIALKPLLIDLTGVNLLEGSATITLDMRSSGNSIDELLPALSGNAKIAIRDGELDILDALYLLDFAVAKYDNAKLPVAPRKRITKFQSLDGNFVINNGIAKSNKLMLVSSELTATGSGKINLVKQKLNLRIDLHYTGKDKKVLELQEKVGGSIPVIISGQFSDLKTEVDYPLLLRRAAAARLGKTVDDASKKVEKHIEKLGGDVNKKLNDVGKQLQNFFQ